VTTRVYGEESPGANPAPHDDLRDADAGIKIRPANLSAKGDFLKGPRTVDWIGDGWRGWRDDGALDSGFGLRKRDLLAPHLLRHEIGW
jgi:hypothetical protein